MNVHSVERAVDSRLFMFRVSGINILLRGDVVVPKRPHSEPLLEVTTLRPVRPKVF